MPEIHGKLAKILIVDDHPVVRKGLAALIGDEHDLVVCGEAEGEEDALQLVERLQPDLAVVDLTLKTGHGVELIKRIRALGAPTKILVSSMHDEGLFAERAIRAGAMGYINKQEAPERIIHAIRHILGGKHYLSPPMHERILRRMSKRDSAINRAPIETLSDRELAVFELIGHGRTTREAADTLHIGVKTVETYCQNIKLKLSLKNYAELRSAAVKWVLENR
jgi:DNA-binding NarL/FixJ family response regulator